MIEFLPQAVAAIMSGEENLMANLANISAVLNEHLDNINWVGFYLFEEESQQLVLGPFQGKAACIRIDLDRGVCGKAYRDQSVQRIEDVHQFPGHIACDPASQSEIVLPFNLANGVSGVLDIDAPIKNRFSQEDQRILTQVVEVLEEHYQA